MFNTLREQMISRFFPNNPSEVFHELHRQLGSTVADDVTSEEFLRWVTNEGGDIKDISSTLVAACGFGFMDRNNKWWIAGSVNPTNLRHQLHNLHADFLGSTTPKKNPPKGWDKVDTSV